VSLKAARAWISPKFFRSSTCGLIIDQPDARYGRTREASRDPTILRRLVWRRAGHAAAPRDKLLPEAELRLRARTLNEHIDSVSLYGGEEGEKQHLNTELNDILRIMWRIVGATTRLTWITAGYGWSTIIAPILIAARIFWGQSNPSGR
jgi:ABC transporter transmembrane region 2